MRRVLTRYDENSVDVSSSENDSSSPFEIDLLNPRPQNKSRVRGSERLSRFVRARSCFANHADPPLAKLPTEQPRCTLAERKYSRIGEISRSDVDSRRDRGEVGIPKIIQAIRQHSEKLNVKNTKGTSSHRRVHVGNSKSSVVVLYDVESNEEKKANSSSPSFSSYSPLSSPSSSPSRPPPVRVSKSEKTLVTVALPTFDKSGDGIRKLEPNTQRKLAVISAETPETALPRVREGSNLRRRELTSRRKRRSVKFNVWKNVRGKRVASSWDFERERRARNPKEQCRTADSFSRCLMAHRSTCSRKIETRERSEEDGVPEGASRVAFLMRHMQNQQRDTRQRGDSKELEDPSNHEKRVFPFQETASGNLKIVPDQVVFESKKVSVLVADPRHTRVNVKAEIGKGVEEIVGVNNEASESVEARPRQVEETSLGYVPRTRPFRSSSQNIHPEEMEENRATEGVQHRSATSPTNHEVPLSSLGFTGEQPIDWQNIILPEKTDLYRELSRRITNYNAADVRQINFARRQIDPVCQCSGQTNADCIVRLGHDEFHCHLLVLQSYSAYFDEKNCKEVDLTGSSVTSKAFGIIYDWMISPTSESCHLLRRDNILEIFMAAQQLGIKELEEQCWAFIDNDELFTEDTAFLLYLEARKIGNTAVMELMVPRIMKFFLMLVSTRDFLELSIDELCLLLRSNYICVNSEMEVLMSAVRWLMHDWQTRKQHMIQVLKCVRFGLIAPWQLIDVKRNPENPEFMELMSYPEIQKMVDDGLAFVIIKYWYGNQTEDYYHWIDLLGLTEPTNRNWAGEDKNYVTYREFLLYLEEYQRTKMPELKSRKTAEQRSSPRQKDPAPGASYSAGKSEAGNPEASATVVAPGGDVGGGRPTNDLSKSDKYGGNRIPGPSCMGLGPPPLAMGGAPGMTMPPEILGRYLSSFDRRVKGTTFRHLPHEQRSNAAIPDEEPRKRSPNAAEASRRQCREPNANIAPRKIEKREDGKRRSYHEEGDSSKSEEEAATTIQAIYRGYRARSKFHEIRKSCSEERQKTRKIAELLGPGHGSNSDKLRMESVRLSVSLAGRSKNDQRESKIPRRSPSPRKKRLDCTGRDDQSAISKNFEGLRLEDPRSGPDEINRHRETGDSVWTIHRPGILHSFDEKTSSISQSENTDTETDIFSPRTNNPSIGIFPCNRSLLAQRSDSVIGESGSTRVDYHGKDSLFFSNCESILVFGGLDPHQEYGIGGNTAKDIYRFKSLDNEWEYVGEIPEPRHRHSTVYLGGRVYLVGGADPRNENIERKELVVGSVWSFDPVTRVWFTEAELLTPRKDFGLVVINEKIYAIGGQDKNGIALKSVEAFDPSKREWREMRPMSAPRIGPAASKYRELIWIGGGMTKSSSKKEVLTREVECYDPLSDRWLQGEPFKSPRCFASMYVIEDCLYAIGGAAKTSGIDSTGGITDSIGNVDVWDRKTLVWRQHGEIDIARHGQAIGSIGDQLLVIGGLTTVYMKSLRSVECYCCRTGKIVKGAASLPYPLSGHGSVTLPAANLLTTK